VSLPSERTVRVNGHPCRVWEKGAGAPLGYLSAAPGLHRWTPFLERLSHHRCVIAPSIPGFIGATGHDELDDTADWVSATLDLMDATGLDGADLIGASAGGMLAAEVAAFSQRSVGRLALIGPYGLFDEAEPVTDVFAQHPRDLPGLFTKNPEAFTSLRAAEGEEEDRFELEILLYRGREAAARLLWPFGDRGLRKRLHRIVAPTLLVWGAEDRVIPPSYAKRFAEGISGPTEIQSIEEAGHLADLDAPDAVAEAVLRFFH
jgi:pimeloyl-ACP methyl ester carboxylesterase